MKIAPSKNIMQKLFFILTPDDGEIWKKIKNPHAIISNYKHIIFTKITTIKKINKKEKLDKLYALLFVYRFYILIKIKIKFFLIYFFCCQFYIDI